MIEIKRKEDCVGCEACVQICPKKCISFNEDEQGFKYPLVDKSMCIDCSMCEKVCPVINQDKSQKPINTCAAINPDEKIRKQSSSGGIFHALAKEIIKEGGIVFGARFDHSWNVFHDSTNTIEGIVKFQKSKYVQSNIGESYVQVQRYLKLGKKVLFTGTPCQIAGLRKFLRKEYGDQLLLVDTACHGVPSPLIWQTFLNHIADQEGFLTSHIKHIDFRDKRNGWESYGMELVFNNEINNKDWFSPMRENVYMQGFIKDLYLRPSCYACPAKCGKSHSDITLADFWGILEHHPEVYSDKGVSLVLINSEVGRKTIQSLNLEMTEVSYAEAIKDNPAIIRSARKPKLYDYFWKTYKRKKLEGLIITLKKMRPSIIRRVMNKGKRWVKSIMTKMN